MSSTKIETPGIIWRRFLIFGFVLLFILWIIDRIHLDSRLEEERVQIVLNALENQKVLSNELHSVFHGVQDDFNYLEKKILNLITLPPDSLQYKLELKSQLEFLETHSGYFKVRLTNDKGHELFKIVQNNDHVGFHKSKALYNLAEQFFYKELNRVPETEFYFSSMDANIINGVVERPIRPTVRVSKRVKLPKGQDGLLIFNIDGQRILKLFDSSIRGRDDTVEIALVDNDGFYVASYPRLTDDEYTLNKTSLKTKSTEIHKILTNKESLQGSVNTDKEIIVYSRLILPKTNERWMLITRIPDITWKSTIYQERLTWIFWEAFAFVLAMTWLWRDEKKRHKDEVVKILLKERSEFIQNVSHQLKTPLAIMMNALVKNDPNSQDWLELRKETNFLIKVVEDMLLLAQVDAFHKIPTKREDVLEIVSAAVDMTGQKARNKGVQIRFNVDDKLLLTQSRVEKPVLGELLQSAIVNIIDNAIDFSPVGETVYVYLAYLEGRLIIQIKDNGPGIPEDFIPKLYERFSRSNNLGRKGTGLGLSIAKKIVELHNGELVLVNYKNGATFEIRL